MTSRLGTGISKSFIYGVSSSECLNSSNQKPNSQTSMDFLNHREGGLIFYQVFLLLCILTYCRNCKRKKYKSIGKAVEVTLNSKEENSEDFCLDFVQEFSIRSERRVWLLLGTPSHH